MKNIFDLTKLDIENFIVENLQEARDPCKPKVRAKQIFKWIYTRDARTFDLMTDISKKFREVLVANFNFDTIKCKTLLESQDGTKKILWELHDGNFVESVWIPSEDRTTLCVSSQVGCQMDCKFCETGKQKFTRNLESYEIVSQVIEASKLCGPISNIVFMGQGEPFMNMDNLKTAITILLDQEGLNFSKRKITVSTSGLVDKIYEFAKWPKEILANLAISLNATENDIRSEIMPVNKRFPIEELLEACRKFPLEPHRRITFEYVILKGINDRKVDAENLTKLLKGIPSKINLIPYNQSENSIFKSPDKDDVNFIWQYLLERGFNTIIRASRGQDIMAACGQLAGAAKENKK